MSEISRQYEGKHTVTTISIRSKTIEGHSLLSQEKVSFEEALGAILDPKSDKDALTSALDQVTHVDHLVDEHCKAKV